MFVAAGVGLRLGWAWIAPPEQLTRGQAVARAGRDGVVVALGLVVVFAISAVIEAFVTPAPAPTALRIAVGATAWLAFLTYVFVLGSRTRDAAGDSPAVQH